jgi:pimeloyl-ACP methyl ester carboxylesterase
MQGQSGAALSSNGVLIHYDVQGAGSETLVLVHGWCCDRRYWRHQVDHLADRFTVVCVDLAGHGESGRDRQRFTISAFAEDVVAVVKQLRLDRVVLIGHSMSGGVIVEAARRLGSRVIGLVGVDTLWNVDQERSSDDVAAFIAPFRADFPKAARGFVRKMFPPTFEAALAAEITSAVAEFPSVIGTEALESSMGNGPTFAKARRASHPDRADQFAVLANNQSGSGAAARHGRHADARRGPLSDAGRPARVQSSS